MISQLSAGEKNPQILAKQKLYFQEKDHASVATPSHLFQVFIKDMYCQQETLTAL